MPTNYEYSPLNPNLREFRVLALQPGSDTDSIQCLIRTTSISTSMPYEALSYCWGDASITENIEVEGYRFPVTSNLFAALLSLRLEHSPRIIWIDAICIDQSNVTERESQVGLMRNIYQQASRVVIWLGPDRPKTGLAFWLLHRLTPSGLAKSRLGAKPMASSSRENQHQKEVVGKIRYLVSSHPEMMECVEIFFSDLITRDWWRRVWILQEAALAQSLLVKCGEYELDWDHFFGVAFDISMAFNFWGILQQAEELNKRSSDFERLASIQCLRSMTSSRSPLSLSDLVAFSRRSRATEPKDMVYSFLGLAQDGTVPLLMPKYSPSISYMEVYVDLVEQSISQNRSLDIITMSRSRFSTLGLPTWVPDWQALSRSFNANTAGINAFVMEEDPLIFRYGDSIRMQEHLYHQVMDDGAKSGGTLWRASSDLPADAIISRQPAVTLTSKGVCVDTMRDVSTDKFSPKRWENMMLETFGNAISQSGNHSVLSVIDCCFSLILRSQKDDLENSGPMNWIPWLTYWTLLWTVSWLNHMLRLGYHMFCELCYKREHLLYIGGGDVVYAFAQTLFANRAGGGRLTKDNFEGFWTACASGEQIGRDVAYRKVIHLALMTSIRCRRFFITKNGYIGLAPSAAREGDLVCVLWGCSVPIVLRREGDHHIFVGECYTHGIMDGEVIDMATANRLDVETFVLH